jgi:carboxymethylenebutenolidase
VGDQAYYVGPEQPGPGVLLLPPWWGTTAPFRRRADMLADEGFTVLAPDLNFGARPDTEEEAERVLGEANPDRLASMVQASGGLLAERAGGHRIHVVGFGMGGSLGLWLSVRRPDLVASCVSVYGHQTIDFAGARARYQLHFAAEDPFVSNDDAAFLEATMRMEQLDVEVVAHDDTRSGFADDSGPHFDEDAAESLWQQVIAFLHAGVAHAEDVEAAEFAARVDQITAALRAREGEGPGPD